MKKLFVLLTVLFGLNTLAHAVDSQGAPQQAPSPAQQSSSPEQQQPAAPATNDADKVGAGSGDDADTADDADPANDRDPEADESPYK